jgi:hypothetical protein
MHAMWDSTRHIDAGALMDAVLLEEARVKCIGHPRDEMICQEVASVFAGMHRLPLVVHPAKRIKRVQEGIHSSRSIQNLREDEHMRLATSGRLVEYREDTSAESVSENETASLPHPPVGPTWVGTHTKHGLVAALQSRRQAGMPAMHIPAVDETLQRATVHGLKNLPWFQEDPRTQKKNRAGSVVRASLQGWLDSDEGRQWMDTKRKRLEQASGKP